MNEHVAGGPLAEPPGPAVVEGGVALCLPGGGVTGAMYQVGALAALEDAVAGLEAHRFQLYVGSSSGATVAAAIAGGIPVERLYRALLDPADTFFPLERGHLTQMDLDEWRRTLVTSWGALRHGLVHLFARTETSPAKNLLEQIDRLNDSLPAGLFKLDRYEAMLAEFFLRRGIPNTFRAMSRALRIPAHDLDTGERVVFGAEGHEDVPVSLACAASLALPLFYSPVRIGDRHFIDGGLGHVAHLDLAEQAHPEVLIVINPLVPVSTAEGPVPTGHGARSSVRDKGLLWIYNQAMRIGAAARLQKDVSLRAADGTGRHLIIEPASTDAALFLHNPASFHARRAILEHAYRTTRERLAILLERDEEVARRLAAAPRSVRPAPSRDETVRR